MSSRFGLRPRLAAWIAVITLLSVGTTFVALYQGTESDLRSGIDHDLNEQAREFTAALPAGTGDAQSLAQAAGFYLKKLRFQPASRVIIVQIAGGPALTNESELLDAERRAEQRERADRGGRDKEAEGNENGSSLAPRRSESEGASQSTNLLNAPLGFSEVSVEDVGKVRLLSTAIESSGRQLGTFRVGQPLQSVENTQSGLIGTFLIVGLFALIAAIALGYAVATRTSRPLRRMAATAASVDAGDLTHRIQYGGPKDEVGVLAESFNHMLDRIERAFLRERAFLSEVSHELRTPLTVIRGQLEVLAREPSTSPEEVIKTTEVVTREVDRMNRLVEELMLLARAEEQQQFLQLTQVDVREFFGELGDELTLLGKRHWELPEPPPGRLRCDPDRLAQVVRNLVRNAVEHTEGDGSVGLAVRAVGKSLLVAVKDDGPGIAEQELKRIFDRFYRTDSSRSRVSGGTGLGLAIARAIVEAHGGRIWAESKLGHGTAIKFELPGYRAPR